MVGERQKDYLEKNTHIFTYNNNIEFELLLIINNKKRFLLHIYLIFINIDMFILSK